MKTIKIKFVDFWKHWDPEDNFIVNVLNKNYKVIISEEPDYIFFSNFNPLFDHMEYNNCIKIFYTQENIMPDFNFCDYAIGFDNLNLGDRYMRYPIYFIENRYGHAWKRMLIKHKDNDELQKDGFCSFVVSNGEADILRQQAFDKLNEYKRIASGGRYLNNIGMTNGVENKIEFESNYKFSLCFENSSHAGYSTEKIVEAFAAKTIPIYWGDSNICDIFNSKSFINVMDFESLDDLMDRIREIDEDDSLYKKILNEPALKNDASNVWEEKQKELDVFLNHIFEQSYEQAFRRNRVFWGAIYEKRYADMKKYYIAIHENKIIKFVIKIRNWWKNRWIKKI